MQDEVEEGEGRHKDQHQPSEHQPSEQVKEEAKQPERQAEKARTTGKGSAKKRECTVTRPILDGGRGTRVDPVAGSWVVHTRSLR